MLRVWCNLVALIFAPLFKNLVAMQENPVESGILVIQKLELQCARFEAGMRCRQGFCNAQETDLMPRRLAVARSVVTRVAMGRDAVTRNLAAVIERVSGRSGAGSKTGRGQDATDGKQNGKQNDNEVCLGIEAMHLREPKGAQSRMTAREWPACAETGTQIAQMSEQVDGARARDATARVAPACALGIFGGLGLSIVQITSFSSRTIVRGAPVVCMDVPVIGAGIAGDVERPVAGPAVGPRVGVARSRPARSAARPGRISRRPSRRGAVRATFLRTVPGRSRAGHAAAGARANAGMRDAAGSNVRMPNDFKEARIIVLDVVKM
ncbi:hypothetical protein [Burkholderia plantarii]|uniref:hypothetical protein n=1 Tax=Burkholderia plantarii TaxID=41899 RepID=UPI00130D5452|nr:hypothetical protein [Burkholderia plantarii]